MLRLVVLLVLLANGLFFAWAQGWLGPTPRHAEREPERLSTQQRPEVIGVLPPGTAGSAVQAVRNAARLCLETGPLAGDDLSAAEAMLLSVQLPADAWARQELPARTVWLVYAGRYPDAPLRRAREEDLRKLGLNFETLNAPPELAPGLVLSRQGSRAEAEDWLKTQAPAGLRGARVVQLGTAVPSWRLRVANADAEQAERLKGLATDSLAGGFKPCAARP
jgi:hypothetical protein